MVDRSASPHVMVIAGDSDVLTLLDTQLRGAGYRVSCRAHPERDLDAVAALTPDAIVLDYQWSSTDNGWSLLQLLRMSPATAAIPILLCTGAIQEVRQLSAQLHVQRVHVLPKPFTRRELLSEVDRLIAEFATAAPR